MSMDTEWYYPWDVASGCLWSSSALTGYTLVAYFDGEKYILKGDKDYNPPDIAKNGRFRKAGISDILKEISVMLR
jgi:hypothetical protein